MNIIEALREASIRLTDKDIQEPIRISRILLADLLNVKKELLIIEDKRELDKDIEKKFFIDIEKICNNIPLQYITKKQEFMGYVFEVDESVLIPRPDTEILVEEVLKLINNGMEVLELCAGSGAISVSIANIISDITVTATDISEAAIKVASKNAKKYNKEKIIKFIKSDMFKNVKGKFNLIISNPPYIETETIKTLSKEVKKEPFIALDGGEDGLEFYRIIAKEARNFLKPNGYICMEIGYNQKESVLAIFEKEYKDLKCIKDLANNDRVIVCRWEE